MPIVGGLDVHRAHLPVQAQRLILGSLFPVMALVLNSMRVTVAGPARQCLPGRRGGSR